MRPGMPRAQHELRAESLARIVRDLFPAVTNALVVGCGDGVEAAVLADTLGVPVTGIDIATDFQPEAVRTARLQFGDAQNMEFKEDSFDLIYSYHSLEHISNPRKALSEMRRVLRQGGGFVVGTPNRLRLVGYMGSDISTVTKLRWNLRDWSKRVTFQFRNECGAHAGFSAHELSSLLDETFGKVIDLNYSYFASVYPGHVHILDFLFRSGLNNFLLPSVYFAGAKEARDGNVEGTVEHVPVGRGAMGIS